MTDNDEDSISVRSMLVAAVTLVGLVGSWFWSHVAVITFTDLTFTLLQIVGVSIVIWQACDPFADGRNGSANVGGYQVVSVAQHFDADRQLNA